MLDAVWSLTQVLCVVSGVVNIFAVVLGLRMLRDRPWRLPDRMWDPVFSGRIRRRFLRISDRAQLMSSVEIETMTVSNWIDRVNTRFYGGNKSLATVAKDLNQFSGGTVLPRRLEYEILGEPLNPKNKGRIAALGRINSAAAYDSLLELANVPDIADELRSGIAEALGKSFPKGRPQDGSASKENGLMKKRENGAHSGRRKTQLSPPITVYGDVGAIGSHATGTVNKGIEPAQYKPLLDELVRTRQAMVAQSTGEHETEVEIATFGSAIEAVATHQEPSTVNSRLAAIGKLGLSFAEKVGAGLLVQIIKSLLGI